MALKHPAFIQLYDNKTRRHLTVKVWVNVDIQDVANRLGRKAFESKSGKSVSIHGAVSVEVDTAISE